MIYQLEISAVTILVFILIFYVIAQIIKNNSIIDIGWGLGFLTISTVLLLSNGNLDIKDFLITSLIALWGLRLSIHIFLRNAGKGEDYRYAEWRKDWGDKAALNAFYRVFLLQGILILIIALPILFVFNSTDSEFYPTTILGVIIFFTGFLFESTADIQLYTFKEKRVNKGKIIKTGLWKITRHPNYFGEAVLWWGIFILSIDSYLSLIGIVSPLLLNFLLIKVSGIPLLEKKYEGNREWEEYKKMTPAFIPFFGKK